MSQTRCPSELEWTKYLAGELRWLASRRLRGHVAGCAGCRQELDAIAADRAAFSADPRRRRDLEVLAERARGSGRRRGRVSWAIAAVGLAGAATAGIVIFRAPGPAPEWTSKGGDLLTIHVERASGAVPLGATCAAGDRLMASYATANAYLLLLERDGQGRIQVLLPPGGTASARLATSKGTTAQSFVLDDVKGRECFAAFFSDAPIDAERAGEALAKGRASPALPGAVVRMQCCSKEEAQ